MWLNIFDGDPTRYAIRAWNGRNKLEFHWKLQLNHVIKIKEPGRDAKGGGGRGGEARG